MRAPVALSALLMALILIGCAERDARMGQSAAGDAGSSMPGLAPPETEDPRHARFQKALRGLIFENGLVRIDKTQAQASEGADRPASAHAAYDEGMELLRGNRRTDAVAVFARGLRQWPDNARLYYGLGRALFAKGKAERSAAAFRTAVNLDADLLDARYHLGIAQQALGRFNDAIETWSGLLRQSPDDAQAHLRLASVHQYLEQNAVARRHLARAESLGATIPSQLRAHIDNLQARPPTPRDDRQPPTLAPPLTGDQTRVDLNGGIFAANETSIATSDANPDHIVASWNDYRVNGSVRMGVSLSLDGGATWNDFLLRPPLANRTNIEGDPMTAYDNRTGTLWVGAIAFLETQGGIFVARKDPADTSFDPAVMAVFTASADKGWMAAGRDPEDPDTTQLYIAYNQGLLKSSDMGDTWSGPTSLDAGLGFLPRVGPGGELYIVYWDYGFGVRLLRSYDGGASFGPSILIATRMDIWGVDNSRFPGTFRVAPIQTFAVDPVNGNLYVVFFDTTNLFAGGRNVDLYFTRSTDQGTTWSTPVVIHPDSDPPGDQFFPWLEVDQNGRIHLLWYDTDDLSWDDEVEEAFVHAYYAWSDDAGITWEERTLTPAPFNSEDDGRAGSPPAFIGDYLGMAVGGDIAYPCYLSNQNGDSDIFIHRIDSAGRGDMNCDGVVDIADVEAFVLALVDPPAYIAAHPDCFITRADMNADASQNGDDVQLFTSLLVP